MLSLTLWFTLRMSTILWVRSSSDRIPDSRVIEGLTARGGTGRTWRTNHSGLAAAGLKPRSLRSSFVSLSSLSLIATGRSLVAPPSSVISWKIVGLVNSIWYCCFPQ